MYAFAVSRKLAHGAALIAVLLAGVTGCVFETKEKVGEIKTPAGDIEVNKKSGGGVEVEVDKKAP